MPTYVYKFIDTGETIEVQQSFTDDPLTEAEHPATGAVMPVKKVFLPVGVSFKGGGFYKTDSRSGSGSSAKSPAAAAGGSEASSGSGDAAAPAPSTTPVPASTGSSASTGSAGSSTSD